MQLIKIKPCFAGLLFAAVMATVSGAAHAAVLFNSDGGDGYQNAVGSGFILYGSDNGSGPNYTTYTTTAASDGRVTFRYTYATHDSKDAFWDPAGYVINNTYLQLSPTSAPVPFSMTGVVSFDVAAGDSYGFYVQTYDGNSGRGNIQIYSGLDGVSTVPLPATAPMFGAALVILACFQAYRTRPKSIA